MVPPLDILWIDSFMKSIKINKTISKLNITFNELSTAEFENKSQTQKFIRRNHLNLGSILRINPKFKDDIEQLIMSWFGECCQLYQVRLIRHIQDNFDLDDCDIDSNKFHDFNMNLNTSGSNRYKIDENIDFQHCLPFEKKQNIFQHIDQSNHNMAFYGISKRKKENGEVFG